MASPDTPPPAGATWVGDWDLDFDDRVFGGDAITVAGVAVLLTGVQSRDGSTVSGVALRIQGTPIGDSPTTAITTDLTAEQAHELAAALATLADRAAALDYGPGG